MAIKNRDLTRMRHNMIIRQTKQAVPYKMNNVIFLDIDGVLNSRFWKNENQREISEGKHVDPEMVKRFAYFVKKTNAYVILHSGWRFWFDEHMNPKRIESELLVKTLNEAGITISGITPDLTNEEIRRTKKFSLVKADEIILWLKENPVDNWVVFDDLNLNNNKIEKHQVRTDADVGLTDEDIEKAYSILGFDTI